MNRAWFIGIGDLFAFIISFLIISMVRFGGILTPLSLGHILPFSILCLSWILIFHLFNLYDVFTIKPTIPHLKKFAVALLTSFAIGILLFYFIPIFGISPKTNLVFQVLLFGSISFTLRRIFYSLYVKTLIKDAIFIGNKIYLDELFERLKNNPQLGLNITSYIEDIKDLKEDISKIKNTIFIVDTISSKISNIDALTIFNNKNEIVDVAQAYEKYLHKIPVKYITTSWIIENVNMKKDIIKNITSFMLDKIFAISILLLFSPILFIAIMSRLIEDGKPIFIKQKRVGLNGKIFDLYKVRSMIAISPDGSAETGKAIWATGKDDPRITKVGRIIRGLHIDEIPQMINILKGDISLVGPRPERPEFVKELPKSIPHYELRHIIRPGFTGWAQIKYKYTNTIDESKEKFEYDLYYIKNRNIFLDIGIILRTVIIIFTH